MVHPEEACGRIEDAVLRALATRAAVRPCSVGSPVALEVQVHRPTWPNAPCLCPEWNTGPDARWSTPHRTSRRPTTS
ncbi:hypothetical protein ACQPXB_11550 [Amycolatopsis sp. CA-161197]|uniref:hypothetical protein n=1 Tax=Amycolatopsis sp. CA-161197 TaxID=3239922 RepID=UPI003D8BE3AB